MQITRFLYVHTSTYISISRYGQKPRRVSWNPISFNTKLTVWCHPMEKNKLGEKPRGMDKFFQTLPDVEVFFSFPSIVVSCRDPCEFLVRFRNELKSRVFYFYGHAMDKLLWGESGGASEVTFHWDSLPHWISWAFGITLIP